MRKIYYMSLMLWVVLGACQKNEKNDFESDGAVYFQTNTSSWSDYRDSVVYSFVGKEGNEQTLNVQVNLMGDAVNYERHIRVVVDLDRTTAEEGLHYKALEKEYILPANEYNMLLPIVLYNKDPRLEEQSFQLVLKLVASEDLQLGLTNRTSVRVVISKMLTKPSYWEEYYLNNYFGPYSKVKHEYFIRVLGVDFPTQEEYAANLNVWKVYGKYMDNYFLENYPIYDENGIAIEPWL